MRAHTPSNYNRKARGECKRACRKTTIENLLGDTQHVWEHKACSGCRSKVPQGLATHPRGLATNKLAGHQPYTHIFQHWCSICKRAVGPLATTSSVCSPKRRMLRFTFEPKNRAKCSESCLPPLPPYLAKNIYLFSLFVSPFPPTPPP